MKLNSLFVIIFTRGNMTNEKGINSNQIINKFMETTTCNNLSELLLKNYPLYQKMIKKHGFISHVLSLFVTKAIPSKPNNKPKHFSTEDIVYHTFLCFNSVHPRLGELVQGIMTGNNFQKIFLPVRKIPKNFKLSKVAFQRQTLNLSKSKLLKNRNKLLKNKRTGSLSNFCVISSTEKPSMVIEPEGSLRGLVMPAHEMMHACSIATRKPPYDLNDEIVTEIESHFAERIMIDYLYENKIISLVEKYELLNIKNNLFIKDCFDNISDMGMMQLFNNAFENGEDIDKKIADLPPDFVTVFLNSVQNVQNRDGKNFEYQLRYTIGHIVANEMYEKYKSNKDYMDWYLQVFMKKIATLNYKEAIILCDSMSYNVTSIKCLPQRTLENKYRKSLYNMISKCFDSINEQSINLEILRIQPHCAELYEM